MSRKLKLPDWVIGLTLTLLFLFAAATDTFSFRPAWVGNFELAVIVLFGLFITLILPKLNVPAGAAAVMGLLAAYGIVAAARFSTSNVLLGLVFPMLFLISGYLLLLSKRFLFPQKSEDRPPNPFHTPDKEPAHAAWMRDALGLRPDKRRHRMRADGNMNDLFYDLGRICEQNQDFSKALVLYRLILDENRNYKDLQDRVQALSAIAASSARGASEAEDVGRFRGNRTRRPVLAHYELLGEIGRSADGVVFKAREAGTRRLVAIKTLDFSELEPAAASELKDRFRRAAESVVSLTHPNIATIYNFGEENSVAYIVMEYLKGSTLRRYTRPDHLLPLRETLSVIVQIAEALNYAHAKGVLHGGLTPENVFWNRKAEKAKVTDFATSHILFPSNAKKTMGMNLPYYMSPEQLSGKNADGRSDIFSVGLLLFELLTGQKAFAGDDISSLMLMIAKDKHPSAKCLNKRVPLLVERILDRALEKDPQKRYESAGQMASGLEEVIVRIDEITAQKTPGSRCRATEGIPH